MTHDAPFELTTFVETRPGLDALVNGLAPQDSLVTEVHRFVQTPGVRDSQLGSQLERVLADESRSARPSAGLLGTIRRLFSRREVVVASVHQVDLPLTAFWLWVPEVASAATTFTLDIASGGEKSASIEIFGIGGGPTFDILVKDGIKRSVERSEKIQLTVPATIEQVQVKRDHHVELSYPRLVRLDSPRTWSAVVLQSSAELEKLTPTVTYDLVDDAHSTTARVSSERGATWANSLSLTIKSIGLDAGLKYSMTMSEQCSFEYKLPPRFVYSAYEVAEHPGYAWSVGAAKERTTN